MCFPPDMPRFRLCLICSSCFCLFFFCGSIHTQTQHANLISYWVWLFVSVCVCVRKYLYSDRAFSFHFQPGSWFRLKEWQIVAFLNLHTLHSPANHPATHTHTHTHTQLYLLRFVYRRDWANCVVCCSFSLLSLVSSSLECFRYVVVICCCHGLML